MIYLSAENLIVVLFTFVGFGLAFRQQGASAKLIRWLNIMENYFVIS